MYWLFLRPCYNKGVKRRGKDNERVKALSRGSKAQRSHYWKHRHWTGCSEVYHWQGTQKRSGNSFHYFYWNHYHSERKNKKADHKINCKTGTNQKILQRYHTEHSADYQSCIRAQSTWFQCLKSSFFHLRFSF